MLLSNQYRVQPTIELRQTDYPSDRPHILAEQWREQGWYAAEHRGRVRVFHGPEAPLPLDQAEASELLPLTSSKATLEALNGTLGRELVKNGYRRREGHKYTRFRSEDGRLHPSGLKGVKVRRCRTWMWDFDFQGEDCWLTPKPTWTKVTETPAVTFAARFGRRYPERRWTMVDLRTGQTWTNQALAEYREAEWAYKSFTGVIYHPRTEADDVPPSIEDIHAAVQAEPAFSGIADVQRPRELDPQWCRAISGQRLKIRKTPIVERKEVNRRGVHRKPLYPVMLTFLLPSQDARARQALTYRFGGPVAVKHAGMDLPAMNVPRIWNTKWKLQQEAPLTWSSSPLGYDPATGELSHPDALQTAMNVAHGEGKTLVTVAVLPAERMTREAMAALLEAIRPFNHVLFSKEAYAPEEGAEKAEACWSIVTRLALKILRAGGGVPYELDPLPGTSSGTYYLGLDVGSAHRGGWSNVGMVLVDSWGHVIAKRVERFEENNERIPTDLLTRTLPGWLKELSEVKVYDRVRRIGAIRPQHLIVHRDGKFAGREAEELQAALGHLQRLDLIEVKKNSALRVQMDTAGPCICQPSERTAVVFNAAALERRTRPIEVHTVSDTDVLQAAEQVFWLSEMRTDELYLPGRLPLTTFLADRIATTAS